jgi:glycosyltransferase involved in cell wall biosynthesis
MTSRIIIEGWQFIPHSFAIVNEFQCLALLARPEIELFHRNAPFWNPEWTVERGLLPVEMEKALDAISLPGNIKADAVLRMGCPFDFTDSTAARTVVFATCEFGRLTPEVVSNQASPARVLTQSRTRVITPSNWSREGLVRSGVPLARIHIVPHGVDTSIFHPVTDLRRTALRKQIGWDGRFVFLHVGAMRPNKGVPLMLEAFAQIMDRHPEAMLALKGLDSMYQSGQMLHAMMDAVPSKLREKLTSRVAFVGDTCTFTRMAALYQAADAYLSPYSGEGFNLPVLEAAACGLPVICTAGGPTDDFVTEDFARRVHAKKLIWRGENNIEFHLLEPDKEHLVALMSSIIQDDNWRATARSAAPSHVATRFTWRDSIEKLLPVLLDS